MARKVFFSFYYKKDVLKVSRIRNSDVVKGRFERSTFLDHADWEKLKKQGDNAVQRWIDDQLVGSTVTCVLIGSETYKRRWVKYEIQKSIERKNAILGIYIHNMKNMDGSTDPIGLNPMEGYKIGNTLLTSVAPTFNWENGNGYNNFSSWIDTAVKNFQSINHFRG
jgi:hypothetical protein